jgi:hypothetical protein
MEKLVYAIVGDLDEITEVIDLARTEGRFLSDEPNVLELSWSATSETTAEASISVDPEKPIAQDELSILTSEYKTIMITTLFDDSVQSLTSEGVGEQVV